MSADQASTRRADTMIELLRASAASPAWTHEIDERIAALVASIRLVAFDFDGVFTDNTVYVFEDGRESVRCWRGDGIGLRQLERLGVHIVILSTEQNEVVSARARKLVVRCIQGCQDKRVVLEHVAAELGVSLACTAFVGNDVNDQTCLRAVGLPIVVQDAHPDVVEYALIRTRTRGGYGAVREVCDLFQRIRDSGH